MPVVCAHDANPVVQVMQVSTQLVAHTRTVSSTGASPGKEHVVLIRLVVRASSSSSSSGSSSGSSSSSSSSSSTTTTTTSSGPDGWAEVTL